MGRPVWAAMLGAGASLALALASCGDDDRGSPEPTQPAGGTSTAGTTATAGPTRTATPDPGPTATPSGLCEEFDANFSTAPLLDGSDGLCAIWRDRYSGEDGWRIKIFYFEADVTDTFDLPANSVEFMLTEALRPIRDLEECRLYRDYQITLWAVFGEREQLVDGMATSFEGCPSLDDGGME